LFRRKSQQGVHDAVFRSVPAETIEKRCSFFEEQRFLVEDISQDVLNPAVTYLRIRFPVFLKICNYFLIFCG